MTGTSIELQGVRVHNLRNFDLQIQRNALTVICGVSGSGKSSLAFDTLFAEGQRRYVETFSPYARQFLDRVERPDVDRIDGIPPAIAIRQNARTQSSRSTVGTRTEILDYLRTLFAKAGQVVCPECRMTATSMTADSAARYLQQHADGCRAMLVFRSDEVSSSDWLQKGFTRCIRNGAVHALDDGPSAGPVTESDSIRIVADRVRIDEASLPRLAESIEVVFAKGNGRCEALIECSQGETATEQIDGKDWRLLTLSSHLMCTGCGREFLKPEAESLNFQSPLGACPTCEGFGQISGMSLEKVVPDPSLSLREKAIQPWTTPAYRHELDELLALASDYDLPTDVPFAELTERHRQLIQDGVPERDFGGLVGFHRWLVRHRYKQGVSVFLNRWRSWLPCPECHGTRVNPAAAAVRLGDLTITEASQLEFDRLSVWFHDVRAELPDELRSTLFVPLQQFDSRLQFLVDCGLDYLSLGRTMKTLSGGEAQRVVLTAALGSGLINTLYVLDEPTSGLHPADTQKVIAATRRLQQPGNTVVVVEHDLQFIQAADEVIEIGPGAGESGGTLVFQGTPDALKKSDTSTTAAWLASLGETIISTNSVAANEARRWLTFSGVCCHNIVDLQGQIPLGVICAVTGVSGSGKSSLTVDALYPAVRKKLGLETDLASDSSIKTLDGWQALSDARLLDQSPLPRSRRSIPATIVGCFDDIRKVMAKTHEAKKRNYPAGMFSFNSARGGRCEHCEGYGVVTIEMQFLADIQTTCEACAGRRFRPDVLEVRYRDRNIHDILNMTADEAFSFFNGHRRIQQRLNALRQAGLGYIRTGQPVATLSGGECQRLRIAALLAGVGPTEAKRQSEVRRDTSGGGTLFVLDEPSTGLHAKDIAALMTCLRHLVEVGHSIVVIEHDPQVIRHADYVIEMGPGAGRHGGRIVKAGTMPVDA
ncbi:MAG: excinuclease ABC subunit UvrA [Fuerstiella sp.]